MHTRESEVELSRFSFRTCFYLYAFSQWTEYKWKIKVGLNSWIFIWCDCLSCILCVGVLLVHNWNEGMERKTKRFLHHLLFSDNLLTGPGATWSRQKSEWGNRALSTNAPFGMDQMSYSVPSPGKQYSPFYISSFPLIPINPSPSPKHCHILPEILPFSVAWPTPEILIQSDFLFLICECHQYKK